MYDFLRGLAKKIFPEGLKSDNNWIVLVGSFVFSISLWFIFGLNQQHTTTLKYPIKFTGIPEAAFLTQDASEYLEISVSGPGIQLLGESLLPGQDSITIPYWNSDRDFTLASQVLINNAHFRDKGLSFNQLITDTIWCPLYYLAAKKIPLIDRVDIQLAAGFQLLKTPTMTPDSIRIIGPKEVVDTIHFWHTEKYTSNWIEKEGKAKLTIFVPDTAQGIKVSPKTIQYTINPQRFTEASIKIPIKIVGGPSETTVKLEKDTLRIDILTPMDKFEEIIRRQFELNIPYAQLDPSISFILPDLSFLPEYVKIIRQTPREVYFVLINKQL